MTTRNDIVIESAELELLLTEGDNSAAISKSKSLIRKMNSSIMDKIKSIKNIFSKKSKLIVMAKHEDGTFDIKVVNPEYYAEFGKLAQRNIQLVTKILKNKGFQDGDMTELDKVDEAFKKLDKIEITKVITMEPVDAANKMHELGGEVLKYLEQIQGVLKHLEEVVQYLANMDDQSEQNKYVREDLSILYFVQKNVYHYTDKLFQVFMDTRDAIEKELK
jgi:hypothetical protein